MCADSLFFIVFTNQQLIEKLLAKCVLVLYSKQSLHDCQLLLFIKNQILIFEWIIATVRSQVAGAL